MSRFYYGDPKHKLEGRGGSETKIKMKKRGKITELAA